MMRTRGPARAGSLGLAAVLVLLLTACGGLPTSGPVNEGQQISDEEGTNDLVLFPDDPVKDATPQQIVEGFIAAGSGPSGNWETAKKFLAPEFKDVWKPSASVVVYNPGDRRLDEVAENEFTLSVTPVATIDAAGELSNETGAIPLSFVLAKQSNGQWRITQAPDGIVLDSNRFRIVYGSYALQFWDPTWTYLVPDTRWFPKLYAASNIAEALVDGAPSPWLEGAVVTSFTDGARLAQQPVSLQSQIAAVPLQEGARALDRSVLDRMQTQLVESMKSVDGIVGVDMLVDDQPLVADSLTVQRTNIAPLPLVLTDDAFGFVSGSSVESVAGLSDALLNIKPSDIEVNADRTLAAVRDTSGVVLSVGSDDTRVRLDTRSGLVAPSIDPRGYIWSVPSAVPGAVLAYGPDGAPISIANAWVGASEVLSQRVSRDGTRIAAVVRTVDGYALWVAGVIRDRDGVPTSLGERKVLSALPGPGTALAWLDASTLAVITGDAGTLHLYTQGVGGLGKLEPAPDAATMVAGGTTQSGGIRLLDATGELYSQRGVNWQHLASGIRVLAIQQGLPR